MKQQKNMKQQKSFYSFRQHSPTLDPFRKYTSIRNTIGSKMNRVATGGASKRYQTRLFAQL